MTSIEERLKMYREKRQFIYDISLVFNKHPKGHTVECVTYEAFFLGTPEYPRFSEWLTVQYHGGAEAHRCISGNSNSANFEVVASMINGGCYDENMHYTEMPSCGWKKLDLNKMCVLQEMK